MSDTPSSSHRNTSRAVSFTETLCEELNEITTFRKKRKWTDGLGAGEVLAGALAPEVPCPLEPTKKQTVPVACASADPDESNLEETSKAHDMSLVGLAFSGGRIRSATFNLGVLQGLADLGLLPMIDYLSTVSGGGNIGSWLCAWILRAGRDEKTNGEKTPNRERRAPILCVQDGLKPERRTKVRHEEPRPIRFLRHHVCLVY
jgi:hypothetical protein